MNGFHYLHEAYTATNKKYTGKVTVPTLWDKRSNQIVNNESSEIIRMLNSEFNAITSNTADYYPPPLRAEIDQLNKHIYHNVNNGVYRCGFARWQAAYDEAYDGLFTTLDELEERLSRRRYLVGDQLTEADWRLFPTLVRFDVAYFSLFKCNKKRIADYPNLSNYMRELYQVPGISRDGKATLLRDQLLFDRQTQPGWNHSKRDTCRSGPAARSRAACGVKRRMTCWNSTTASIQSAPRKFASR